MSTTEKNVQLLDVKKILPDENQPRKFFDAQKMFQIKQSIKNNGIKQPLIVEDIGGGKYLLIDGERRYRSALELGLKTVPAIVEAPSNEGERLILQFGIQENQESWTPIEKAMALLAISRITGLTLQKCCEMQHLDRHTTQRYIAFAELSDKESFVRNEVPIDYAMYIKSLKTTTKVLVEATLEEEFSKQDEKKLEHQLTKMISRGVVTKRGDVTRIMDSFKKDPKLVEKFLTKDNVTPTSLFLEAKAQGTYHLRNAVSSARQLKSHIDSYLKIKDVKITLDELEAFTNCERSLKSMINFAD